MTLLNIVILVIRGTPIESIVHPREALRPAVAANA